MCVYVYEHLDIYHDANIPVLPHMTSHRHSPIQVREHFAQEASKDAGAQPLVICKNVCVLVLCEYAKMYVYWFDGTGYAKIVCVLILWEYVSVLHVVCICSARG